ACESLKETVSVTVANMPKEKAAMNEATEAPSEGSARRSIFEAPLGPRQNRRAATISAGAINVASVGVVRVSPASDDRQHRSPSGELGTTLLVSSFPPLP